MQYVISNITSVCIGNSELFSGNVDRNPPKASSAAGLPSSFTLTAHLIVKYAPVLAR